LYNSFSFSPNYYREKRCKAGAAHFSRSNIKGKGKESELLLLLPNSSSFLSSPHLEPTEFKEIIVAFSFLRVDSSRYNSKKQRKEGGKKWTHTNRVLIFCPLLAASPSMNAAKYIKKKWGNSRKKTLESQPLLRARRREKKKSKKRNESAVKAKDNNNCRPKELI
jgi:hypothetical protein